MGRAWAICTLDRIENELLIIKQVSMQNGYPENLVDKAINSARDIAKSTTVEKKGAYITLPFKVTQSLNLSPDDSLKELKRPIKLKNCLFISVQPIWAIHNSRIKYLVLLPVSVYIRFNVPVEHRTSGVLQGGYLIEFG